MDYKTKDAPSDSLLGRFNKLQHGLIDYLGKDLYSILESGRIQSDMPFGVKSKFDFRNKNINFQKKFGKDYRFDIDIKPDEKDYRFKLTKDIY